MYAIPESILINYFTALAPRRAETEEEKYMKIEGLVNRR